MSETKVIMPQMGESIFEGTITKWLKQAGDKIARDEPLFEISTDKVDSEIPAPASGILKEIVVQEGETVEINTVVALIGDADGAASGGGKPKAKPEAKKDDKKAEAPQAPSPPPEPAPKPVEIAADETDDKSLRSSPLVRRIAREHGISIGELRGKGTGAGGRITKRDVLSYIEQRGEPTTAPEAAARKRAQPATPAIDFKGPEHRVPMTAMRKSIAEHMVVSRRTSAHVATLFEIDCSAVMAARAALKPEFDRSGVRLTVTPFFIQAAVRALGKFPILNASLDGNDVVYKRAINIGIAVALDWGLIVPVVKDAGEQNLLGLAKTINDLGARARTKKLKPDEVQGGTFTITNPGNFGGLFGIPIINQPQVAILGMGGIEKRPIVIGDAIAIRPMVYLSLSFDHRVIDGAVADQFMADIKETLESWKA
jgi:pyruvate dehydrogenase E2 component (dihydrolipoamide acetyltransferase)